jgi:ABC-type multidrug transport system ATPase subunit
MDADIPSILTSRPWPTQGPSGAGKSMFLTAVAGKKTYCNMTGQVLINGQAGNIHAYKRIIGFVPQDDIVHGSLTVEENLRFSANYRCIPSRPARLLFYAFFAPARGFFESIHRICAP